MIVHLHLDAFFVSVERAHNPSLAGRPIVVGGVPGGHGAVVAASAEARRCGVAPSMSLREAERRCPDAVFLPGAFDRYLQASEAIDEIVRRRCPVVEWPSIDEAYFDVASGDRAQGQARVVAERIQEEIRSRLSLAAACGIGSSKIVAKIAAALARPNGLLYVLPGYDGRFLSPLKIELLPGLSRQAVARLHGTGVQTLGELATLDPASLSQLAGGGGAVLARQAAGIDERRVHGETVPRSISEETGLDEGTRDAEQVRLALDALVGRAAYRLRGVGLFARTITVKIRYGDARLETRAATLREASSLEDVLTPRARQLFDALARPHRVIRLVGVSLSGLVPDGRQLSLFPTERAS